MANTFSSLNYHLIWSTKNRTCLISSNIKDSLYKYIGGIVRKENGKLLCIGGIEDHVHLLVSLNPTINISDLIRSIKSKSTSFVKKHTQASFFQWQDGYSAFSVSYSAIDKVALYINSQLEHHNRMSFLEELKLLLKKHKIQYEDKYLI